MQRFHFGHGQVERGQGDSGCDAVANATFAFDGHARRGKSFHVTVDRTQRHIRRARKVGGAVKCVIAQDLYQLHQPIGAAHVISFLIRE